MNHDIYIGENLEVESLLLLLDMLGNMHSLEYVHPRFADFSKSTSVFSRICVLYVNYAKFQNNYIAHHRYPPIDIYIFFPIVGRSDPK